LPPKINFCPEIINLTGRNVMTDKLSVDSNIWLYIFLDNDDQKYKIASDYIDKNSSESILVVSYQVSNEVSNIMRKHKSPEVDIRFVIEKISGICIIRGFAGKTG
jgi:predicted nucleic acid-binding protein